MKEIEQAFQTTSALLFGKPLTNMQDYEEWLFRHVRGRVKQKKSKISETLVLVPDVKFYNGLGSNVVTLQESLELGLRDKLKPGEIASLNLANASEVLAGIKTTTPEIIFSENIGTEESCCYGPTQYCYKVTFTWFSKYIAYSFWSRDSEYLFGCSNVAAGCSFSMKCYSSTKLTRCFEVNDSNNCTDSYFCHNCEGLIECMFCFNTKGKRYAIGNVEIGKETYLKLKKMLQNQIYEELQRTKKLEYDIYGIGNRWTNLFRSRQRFDETKDKIYK